MVVGGCKWNKNVPKVYDIVVSTRSDFKAARTTVIVASLRRVSKHELGTNDIVVWSYSYTMTNTMTGTRQ